MKQGLSRSLVAIEAMLFLAPLSLLAALYTLALGTAYAAGRTSGSRAEDAVFLACCAGLMLAWWIVVVFLRHGRAGLARVGHLPMAIAAVAAMSVVAVATASVLVKQGVFVPPAWLDCLGFVQFGLPALVPFVHIALERWPGVRASRPLQAAA